MRCIRLTTVWQQGFRSPILFKLCQYQWSAILPILYACHSTLNQLPAIKYLLCMQYQTRPFHYYRKLSVLINSNKTIIFVDKCNCFESEYGQLPILHVY